MIVPRALTRSRFRSLLDIQYDTTQPPSKHDDPQTPPLVRDDHRPSFFVYHQRHCTTSQNEAFITTQAVAHLASVLAEREIILNLCPVPMRLKTTT